MYGTTGIKPVVLISLRGFTPGTKQELTSGATGVQGFLCPIKRASLVPPDNFSHF
jgi:hypothetical protein